jgi:lactate 2-monooxygenase
MTNNKNDTITPTLDRQREIYLKGLSGDRPMIPIDSEELERRAERAMSPEAFAYIAGGAATRPAWTATARPSGNGAFCPGC